MGLRRRLMAAFAGVDARSATLAMAVLAIVSSGCRKREEPTSKAPAPVDHLAPGESPEGKEKAFGLSLPRLSHVEARFEKSIVVRSALTREELAGFVRSRVRDGEIIDTDAATMLKGVTPKAAPQTHLDVDVRRIAPVGTAVSEMIVRDVSAPPPEPGLSDAERWRRAGFGPNGEVLDPSKLQ